MRLLCSITVLAPLHGGLLNNLKINVLLSTFRCVFYFHSCFCTKILVQYYVVYRDNGNKQAFLQNLGYLLKKKKVPSKKRLSFSSFQHACTNVIQSWMLIKNSDLLKTSSGEYFFLSIIQLQWMCITSNEIYISCIETIL